jgi:Armadillo/beta-catenin-like repeat
MPLYTANLARCRCGFYLRFFCRSNGIPKLVKLLRAADVAVAASAAGALQNVAREVASRMLICDMDCVDPLARLLACEDITAQARVPPAQADVQLLTNTARAGVRSHAAEHAWLAFQRAAPSLNKLNCHCPAMHSRSVGISPELWETGRQPRLHKGTKCVITID